MNEDSKTSKEYEDGKIVYRDKRKYRTYELKKVYFKPKEVTNKLGISAWILTRELKKLFPHKCKENQKGKRMKYTEIEIEAIRVSLENAKRSKSIAKQVVMKNPDHLFDGFDEIVDMQG